MILDKLENASLYSNISENLKKGFDFLQNNNLSKLTPGRHEIDGQDVFALISEYDTKAYEDCKPEAHQTYTDIQYLVYGKETIGIAMLSDQEITEAYIPEKDIVFFSTQTKPINLEAGMFAVFFPQDIHQPGVQTDGKEKVKKIVVKVKL